MGLIEVLARHTGGPTMKSPCTDAVGGAIHEQRLRKQNGSNGVTHLAPYVHSCGRSNRCCQYILTWVVSDKRPGERHGGCAVCAPRRDEGRNSFQGACATGGAGRSEKETWQRSVAEQGTGNGLVPGGTARQSTGPR